MSLQMIQKYVSHKRMNVDQTSTIHKDQIMSYKTSNLLKDCPKEDKNGVFSTISFYLHGKCEFEEISV